MVAHVPVLAEAVVSRRVACPLVAGRCKAPDEGVLRLRRAGCRRDQLVPVFVDPGDEAGAVGKVVAEHDLTRPYVVVELDLANVAHIELLRVGVESFSGEGPEDEGC